MSIQLKILNWMLKTFERPTLLKLDGPPEGQARLLHQSRLFKEVPGVTYSDTVLSHDGLDVPTLVAHPKIARPRSALLYFHGGAYAIGSPETHRKLAARIGNGCDLTTYIADYRLAPENKFPAAVEDAVAAYQALLERGYNTIAIAGDSAGGGLSFVLLHEICRLGLPKPVAVVGLSPWTDLTASSPSMKTNDATEVMLPVERFPEIIEQYLGDAPRDDPRASPVFGSFEGAPRALIQVSQKEVLFDDALRLADRLREFNVDVNVQTWDNTYHVWQTMHDRVPEATEAVEQIITFLNAQLM